MSDNKDKGPHCELSKQFTGVKRLIHEVLMETELYSGYGAYVLSYADTGDPDNKSGLSFGVNQMDMSKRPKVVEIFKDILQNAKDSRGQYIIPRNKIDALKKIKCEKEGKTPEQIYGKDLALVNAALSSAYGIQKIDEIYTKELNADLAHIEKAISMMQNPAAKTFYSSNMGKVFLFEYHNQFGLELGGSFMREYIDGKYNKLERTDYKTHEKYKASTTSYTLADHKKFIYGTYQYDKTPNVIDNRLEKAENTYNKYSLLAFAEEINQTDMQAERVAIIDNYDNWIAKIINKDIGSKAKSEDNPNALKIILTTDEPKDSMDTQQRDSEISDVTDNQPVEEYFHQTERENTIREPELPKVSFLQINETSVSDVLEKTDPQTLHLSVTDDTQNLIMQDPLKNFFQEDLLVVGCQF